VRLAGYRRVALEVIRQAIIDSRYRGQKGPLVAARDQASRFLLSRTDGAVRLWFGLAGLDVVEARRRWAGRPFGRFREMGFVNDAVRRERAAARRRARARERVAR